MLPSQSFQKLQKGKNAASSSEVPSQARSHRKSSPDEDERYEKLSTQVEEVALAIKKLTDDRLNVNDFYDEVMKTEGFDELALALAFDHMVENEKVAKAFMKLEVFLREEENSLEDALAKDGGSSPSLGATIYSSQFAANALRGIRRNVGTRRARLPGRIPPMMLQKPAEPNFTAEDK
ncbi:hypothetical protein Vadar_008120 [Vaccinium darrowii]|uniref:Uncharacterized protein n=1 Tax=Vaccinium darrowii TaxID=229202 RepID=A0ACB7Y5H8_9ERIC|nr:hypothetical protein Vadar_008120 [Vaccinium darrowii]